VSLEELMRPDTQLGELPRQRLRRSCWQNGVLDETKPVEHGHRHLEAVGRRACADARDYHSGQTTHVATAPPSVGSGRYRLRRRLGRGAFGAVYDGWDLAEDTRVAVKLLAPWVSVDAVLREARLHRRLSRHPRIVGMRNVVIAADPSPFVVMEYVPGGSLQALVEQRRPTIVEAQRWLRDSLEALCHAHGNDVLHRDIKPSNLLLGGDGHVMLSDFGVSEDSVRRAGPPLAMYPAILPPEFGTAPTTVQTDLWLIGVLGWQLLVGGRPDLDAAQAGRLAAPHRRSIDVPIALSRAVMAGLEPTPASRPASAERMLERIAAVPIRAGWHDRIDPDPAIVQTWQADAQGGAVTVSIRQRRKDFLVVATAAPGGRLRARRRAATATLAGARRQARGWLLEVVDGRPL
jgi:serine/threonine protein kinase